MPWKLSIRLAELLVSAILAVALVSAAKQALSQADARQHDRDAQLLQTLATIAAQKRTITTPEQIVRDLPNQIVLPSPIALEPTPTESHAGSSLPGDTTSKPRAQAVIPAEDLKPLYDFTLDCKACQAKLETSQGDLTDERAKTVVLTKERDEAVRAAKGGNVLQRAARAAKWLAIGAALGAVASRAAH